jgi:hypothetical protein
MSWESLSAESKVIVGYMALSTAITAAETAATELDEAPFDAEDTEVLTGLPEDLRLPILARLVSVAETLREGLRSVDAAILVASGGQAITTA